MMLVSITRRRADYAIVFYAKDGRRASPWRRFGGDAAATVAAVEALRELGWMEPRKPTGRAWRRGWTGDVVPLRSSEASALASNSRGASQ